MNLYCVRNGYTGMCSLGILVVAENEENAITLAKVQYKKRKGYDEIFYNRLQSFIVLENVDNKTQATNIVEIDFSYDDEDNN